MTIFYYYIILYTWTLLISEVKNQRLNEMELLSQLVILF